MNCTIISRQIANNVALFSESISAFLSTKLSRTFTPPAIIIVVGAKDDGYSDIFGDKIVREYARKSSAAQNRRSRVHDVTGSVQKIF